MEESPIYIQEFPRLLHVDRLDYESDSDWEEQLGRELEDSESKSFIIPETTEHKVLNDDDPSCSICMELTVECALEPCGHQCICTSCLKTQTKCPQCQQVINRVVRLPFY
jgi:hypothetical protein